MIERVVAILVLIALIYYLSWVSSADVNDLRAELSHIHAEVKVLRQKACP